MVKKLLLVVVLLSVTAFVAVSRSEEPVSEPQVSQTPMTATGTDGLFTIALTGDSIITQRLSPFREPEYLSMIELVRNADVGFTNLEMLLHDYEGYPSAQSGGTYMRAEPYMAKELAWAGIDMVARANNHTGDYSPEASRTTSKYLDDVGIVHAGVGENLQEAREARFLDTADGRIAIISCASTFPAHSIAGRQRSDVRGRPGLNPLRFSTQYVIDQAGLDQLRGVAQRMGLPVPGGNAPFRFLNNTFVVGDTPGIRQTPNETDLREIVAAVKDAKISADYVIVTIHSHEGGKARTEPAQFAQPFARAVIDAGADMFVGHGPHVLRGIEMYKGKPIMYSLGDFIFQNDTVLRLPQDNYSEFELGSEARVNDFNNRRYNNDTVGFPADRMIWESVIAVPAFKGGKLVEMKLHPISLGFGKPSGRRGRPYFADDQLSKKILDDLIKFSQPFGTQFEVKGKVASVKIPTS